MCFLEPEPKLPPAEEMTPADILAQFRDLALIAAVTMLTIFFTVAIFGGR